ncbi:MAG TPA: AAA family ATPase [Thermoanaerobaculia bacterium]|nr:AAA family ATPase [Thermoanaerobaculia bacterium]
MLTRLKVSGFKNLARVDIRFGPFTCVAGVNGVGKSNLFDAIQFLSALADRSLIDAAQSVRAEGRRTTDVDSLFLRIGEESIDEMSFEAEMIVPHESVDDLGQTARASITFLRYSLTLAKRKDETHSHLGPIEIIKEELKHINLGEAYKHLTFDHTASTWRRSAVVGSRRSPFFISTEGDGSNRVVHLHQDSGSGGRPRSISAGTLPRTVVSASNAAENPTALVARREMQSWRLLQLEPSMLREPDDFRAPTSLGPNGAHLAATLYHLATYGRTQGNGSEEGGGKQVYGQIATRLAELIEDIREVWVDADEKRELLSLMASARDGTPHAARALSDGTLRFLALAVLELDPRTQGLICLEEPENGIHPERIPAMLRLLQDIPTDVDEPIGNDNPLRQVIINTHSPAVVTQVPDESLLVAEPKEFLLGDRRVQGVIFGCLPETWRAKAEGAHIISRGKLLAYLNPFVRQASYEGSRRVLDREDIQPLLPL